MASSRYYRIRESTEVWGTTPKCGSTSVLRFMTQPRGLTELRTGDVVRILARDPRDRLVSGWRWFTQNNSRLGDIEEQNAHDHAIIADPNTPFSEWVRTALRYKNEHWLPQTELHPRWREFNIIPLHKFKGPHEKKMRQDNSWEQYYDKDTLDLVNEVYANDLIMWNQVKENDSDGTANTGARVLF